LVVVAGSAFVSILRTQGGEWLSETDMRDSKSFSEDKIKAVKKHCMTHGYWKWDLYEPDVMKYGVVLVDTFSRDQPAALMFLCVWSLMVLANVLLRSDFTGFECSALLDGESGMDIMGDMSDGIAAFPDGSHVKPELKTPQPEEKKPDEKEKEKKENKPRASAGGAGRGKGSKLAVEETGEASVASTRADLNKRVLEIVAMEMNLAAMPYGVSEIAKGLESCKASYERVLHEISAPGYDLAKVPKAIEPMVVEAAMWLDRGKLRLKQEELGAKQKAAQSKAKAAIALKGITED